MKTIRTTFLSIVAPTLTLLTLYGVSAYAQGASWTSAPSSPPSGNVAGPLSAGDGSQTKTSGDISLASGGSLFAGGTVAGNVLQSLTTITSPTITSTHQICLNGNCITSWPSCAAPTVSYIYTGNGYAYDISASPQGLLTPRCACDKSVDTIPVAAPSTYTTECGLVTETNGKGTVSVGGTRDTVQADVGPVCYDQVYLQQSVYGPAGYYSIPYHHQ